MRKQQHTSRLVRTRKPTDHHAPGDKKKQKYVESRSEKPHGGMDAGQPHPIGRDFSDRWKKNDTMIKTKQKRKHTHPKKTGTHHSREEKAKNAHPQRDEDESSAARRWNDRSRDNDPGGGVTGPEGGEEDADEDPQEKERERPDHQ